MPLTNNQDQQGQFKQCLEVVISSADHKACLEAAKVIKMQCGAWYFNVQYDEHKSARKGPVLTRDLLIYQTACAGDTIIFKEAVRRICAWLEQADGVAVRFIDRGSVPSRKGGDAL